MSYALSHGHEISSETISGSAQLGVADQMRAIFWRAPRRLCIYGAVVIAALCVMMASDVYSGTRASPPVLAGAVVAFLVLPLSIAASFRRHSKEQRLITYKINLDQITTQDATGATLILPWTMVSRCIERRSGFAVLLKPRGVRWIPKRAFAAETLPRLREILAMGAERK